MGFPVLSKPGLGALCAALAVPAIAAADDAADQAAILEIWSAYSTARVAGDADAWLGLWDAEGIRLAPGRPAAEFAAFSKGIPAAFANAPVPSMNIAADEVVVMGDWAFSSGNFTVGTKVDGKFLTVFRKQADGSWRIYRDAFNLNTP